ncbi:MAG: crotonobetainyl-CoA:carnitine CoA-transferase CaiB-like acyl-CoA transferase [Oceanicoccus sp.]|jgi:crotonobetainyl-CoA:carnitine CoA-transferase CaiB-like acyl-CoA transferase
MSQRINMGGVATGPLSGVKVIDFTAVYSGPIAASILGDQGAEVIKIESRHGDLMRGGLPKSNGAGSPFTTMNRNKKSLCLDLKNESGLDIARKLIASADVVMENFRPGVMDRLGLGYDQFKETHPKLVYVSINGVGAIGPYVKRPIYDAIIQALSGFTSLQNDEPAMVNSLVCDKVTSLTAAQAVTAALFRAERSGRGQRVELSMLDASLFFLWPDVMNNHTFPDESVENIPQLDHSLFMRKTRDGWIASMPVQQKEADASFRALDIEHLSDDDRFSSAEARSRNRTAYVELTGEAYARFTTDELCQRFEAEDVPHSRINSREDVINDPQIKAMEALWTYDHPQAGEVRSPRPPAQFSETPSNIRAHTPALGEHNTDILTELGYGAADIERLSSEGAIYAE